MTLEEFYKRYAWEPINNRHISLGTGEGEEKFECIYDIYRQIEDLQNQIRPLKIQQDELLNRAYQGFKALGAAKDKTYK